MITSQRFWIQGSRSNSWSHEAQKLGKGCAVISRSFIKNDEANNFDGRVPQYLSFFTVERNFSWGIQNFYWFNYRKWWRENTYAVLGINFSKVPYVVCWFVTTFTSQFVSLKLFAVDQRVVGRQMWNLIYSHIYTLLTSKPNLWLNTLDKSSIGIVLRVLCFYPLNFDDVEGSQIF